MGLIITLLVVLAAGAAMFTGLGALPLLLLLPISGALIYLGIRLATHMFTDRHI